MNVEELAQVINYLIDQEMDPVIEMLKDTIERLDRLNRRLDILSGEEPETFW